MRKTDGVPLFVEELTKMVLESGLLQEQEDRYALTGPLPPLAIPATLHDALMARLDRLAAAKLVAQLGAVIGRTFAYDLMQAVAPWTPRTYARARTLCAQIGETPQVLPTLWGLWVVTKAGGRYQRALGNSSCGWRSATADPTHRLEAHDALGTTLFHLGDYAAARRTFEQGDRPHRPDDAAGPGAAQWRGPWGAVPGHRGRHAVVPGLSGAGRAAESGGAGPGPGAGPSL